VPDPSKLPPVPMPAPRQAPGAVSPTVISSRDNAWFKELRRLAQDGTAYRRQGRVWLEGDHLCRALHARRGRAEVLVIAESLWADQGAGQGLPLSDWAAAAERCVLLPDPLFDGISGLGSPARLGMVMALPAAPALQPQAATVVLDRLQDAGNVGAILRCAAAFGFGQVIALQGTAGLWSPKVLRAGMGAHFGLALTESASPAVLSQLGVPILATSSHAGQWLHQADLPTPCAWVFGHEGQGVATEVAALCTGAVRIVQPGGEESLNVATAAAICLHASAAAAVPLR
jgi:TrmH family RNA methyltransferase